MCEAVIMHRLYSKTHKPHHQMTILAVGHGLTQARQIQFVAGVPARMAAELVGFNRNTAILFFQKLREIIAGLVAKEAPFRQGEIRVDESYFCGARKGKRGRGAAGKMPMSAC